MPPSPAARKYLAETGLSPASVVGTGRRGQVLKQDVLAQAGAAPSGAVATAAASLLAREPKPKAPPAPRPPIAPQDETREERVRMTRLRQTIARRLKEAQDTAAMLTTFNDVDMSAVMQLRREYREAFEKKHGVKLGLHGLLREGLRAGAEGYPRGQCRDRRHRTSSTRTTTISASPSAPSAGLVVPVLRDADRMSLAEIEAGHRRFRHARAGRQAGARGDAGRHLHHLQWRRLRLAAVHADPERAAIGHSRHAPHRGARRGARRADRGAADDVSRALPTTTASVDGKEAVTFLVQVKEAIEDPKRLVLDL